MKRTVLVCVAGLLLLSISAVVQGQDPCQKFHDKYQVCLENRDASLNVDYDACQAITEEGACGLAECYWWAAKSKCVPALCYGDTNFDAKVSAWDYGIYKYEDGRNPCPQTPTNPGYLGAPVPKTGQTTCWDSDGNTIDCGGTGQDGDMQKGVAWPNPRFTDKLNGTVTDNLTGLIWLQNANCFGQNSWSQALANCNNLSNGQCELSDSSSAGDWRLPNIKELQSLIDNRYTGPAIPSGHPFLNLQSAYYWSSTTDPESPNSAWFTDMYWGVYAIGEWKTEDYIYVWCCKGSQ